MAAKQKAQEELETNIQRIQDNDLTLNTTHVFKRAELLALLKHYSKKRSTNSKKGDGRFMVGTVGFPNVGKSSVINVLCGNKRVGVANRPGKTKHF